MWMFIIFFAEGIDAPQSLMISQSQKKQVNVRYEWLIIFIKTNINIIYTPKNSCVSFSLIKSAI